VHAQVGEQMKLFVVDKVTNVTQERCGRLGAKERPVEAQAIAGFTASL